MNIKLAQLCKAFYACKDKINAQQIVRSNNGKEIQLQSNPDSIQLFFYEICSSYTVEFKAKEVSIDYSYFYYSRDDDVRHETKSSLVIRDDQIAYSHYLDVNEPDTFGDTGKTITDGPMSDEIVNNQLSTVIAILEKIITKPVLEAAAAKYDKAKQCESYRCFTEAARAATHTKVSKHSNEGLQAMTRGKLLSTLFSTHIAPLADFQISADDLRNYETVSIDHSIQLENSLN